MSKKVKVLISALVVAALLTMGGVTMVMAEGEEETTPPPEETSAKGLLRRVADILKIDTEDLTDAFKQAQQEMYEEAFINRLNQAVVEGRITQEQADEIIKWWEQRPDDAIIKWWEQRLDDAIIKWWEQRPDDAIITWWEQRPDDAIREWWELKPEVIKPGMFKHNLTFRFRAMPMPGEVINPGMFKNATRFRFSFGNRRGSYFGWGFCPEPPEETN